MNDADPVLFASLLETAFEHLARAVPTVVRLNEGDTSDTNLGSWAFPLPWPHRGVSSLDDMSAAVADLLGEGPVLLFPPWGRLLDSDSRNLQTHEKILLDCEPIGPASLLTVVMPAESMTSLRARQFREAVAERWEPILLLYTSGLLSGIHRSFQIVTVFLRARQGETLSLRFFQLPVDADEQAVQADFRRLLIMGGGRGQFGYVLREPPPGGESLAFDRHDPRLLARRSALSGFGATVPLGEMFERIQSSFRSITGRDLMREADDPAAVRVLTGRDLRRDGTIAPPDEGATWAEIPTGRQLAVGDVLLPSVFRPTDRGGLVAVAVTEEDLPVAAGERVLALRPTSPMDRQQIRFVLQYLRSPLARGLTASLGSSLHLQWSALAELPVPQPDNALATALQDLAEAARRFEEWRSDAESVLESVFTDENINATRTRIVHSGRTLRLRAEAATLLDDYSYVVRTTFPYPIAYRWRGVEAAVSAGTSTDAYKAILDAAEVLLCYAANLALALAQGAGIELGQVGQIRNHLSSGRSGPGFGDWVAALEEVRDGHAFRRLPDTEPLYELRSLLAGQESDAARRRLSDRRNDRAHLRAIDIIDLPEAINVAFMDLTTLIKSANFLSDLPLVRVTAVRWDNYQGYAKVDYRELTGDHPVVPTSSMSYQASNLEVDSLYVMDQQHTLHLLRPFLIGRICPTCRTWSTFHVDRAPRGTVTLKSLEDGHPIKDPSLIQPLQHVGLL